MRVELAIPEPQPAFIHPAESALVIVDMQNASLRRDGGPIVERGARAIAANIALLKKFRAARSKIIHVQSVRKPDALEFTAFGRSPMLIEGSWDSEIIDELTPMPGETVVQKWSHDCFNNTSMEAVLNALNLRPCWSQIVVTGVATNVCYDCAVTGFRVRQFLVYLPLDATASVSEQDELLAFQHLLAMPGYEQYNTMATRSDLVTFDAARAMTDPLVQRAIASPVLLGDPLYKAITTLTPAD